MPDEDDLERLDQALHFVLDKGLAHLIGILLLHVARGDEKMLLCDPFIVSLRQKIWDVTTDWYDRGNSCVQGYHPKLATLNARAKRGSPDTINFYIHIPSATAVRSSVYPPYTTEHIGASIPSPNSPIMGARIDPNQVLSKWSREQGQSHQGSNSTRRSGSSDQVSRRDTSPGESLTGDIPRPPFWTDLESYYRIWQWVNLSGENQTNSWPHTPPIPRRFGGGVSDSSSDETYSPNSSSTSSELSDNQSGPPVQTNTPQHAEPTVARLDEERSITPEFGTATNSDCTENQAA